jgi:hypothetical protein
MNAHQLFKLAKISSYLDYQGMNKESDIISNTITRLAANWQSPYVDIPMLERVWPFSIVDEDFQEADDLRQKFPRYDEKDNIELNDDEDGEFTSLEVSLHKDESDPGAGIKFIWYDGASSLQQGSNWGKEIQKHDENNAAGMRYKNLVPTFY